MNNKVFYKVVSYTTHNGVHLVAGKYHLIHETECFNFVIREFDLTCLKPYITPDIDLYQLAKHKNCAIKRFNKTSGRFAFETKEEAFDHFKMLKSRQIGHLKRDLAVIGALVTAINGKTLDDFPSHFTDIFIVESTVDVVSKFYRFD